MWIYLCLNFVFAFFFVSCKLVHSCNWTLYSHVSMCHYDVQCKICHLKSGIGYLQCFGFGIWYLVLGIGYLVLGIWHLHLICVSFCICICTCINFCILGTSPKGCFVQADFCRGETFLILHEGHNCTFVLALWFSSLTLVVWVVLSCHKMSMQRTGLRLYKVSNVQDALCAKRKTVCVKKNMCKSA